MEEINEMISKKIMFASFNPYVSGDTETYVGLEDEKEDYMARVIVLIKSIQGMHMNK